LVIPVAQPAAVHTHYNLDALIPECNMGLSQFKEDICEPSVPVREFNLIACIGVVQSVTDFPGPRVSTLGPN